MASKKLSASIIIPNYNGATLLRKNLPKVIEICKEANEIIVVDDASTDNSLEVLQSFDKIKVIKNKHNLRFAKACNRGVKHATSDIVVLLNSDVIPEKDFLAAIIEPFADERVFAVGAHETDPVSEIISGRACGEFKKGFLIHKRCHSQTFGDTLWASGGSGAFRKSTWVELGGFDPLFAPAYDEDRDLCYRALKRGYTCLFQDAAKVIHQHETTNVSTFGKKNIEVIGFRNQLLFTWKNTTDGRLVMQHLAWLPYHLIVTTIRTRGIFLLGLVKALVQLFRVARAHNDEKKHSTVTDSQILSRVTH